MENREVEILNVCGDEVHYDDDVQWSKHYGIWSADRYMYKHYTLGWCTFMRMMMIINI